MRIFVFLTVLLVSTPTFSQESAKAMAQQHYNNAQRAYESGEYDAAMMELERAWRLEEKPETLALRVRVLESMGEVRLALDIIEQNRAALSGAQDIYLIEERLREKIHEQNPPSAQVTTKSRSALSTVGPILLGVAGVGLGIWSTILLLPDTCDETLSNGQCREGDESSTALGLGIGVGAVASIIGAIYWWIAGTPDDTAEIIQPVEASR